MTIDLELDEDQKMIQQSASDLFARRSPSTVVREIEASEAGFSADLWREMAGLGWLGITIASEYGGSDGGVLDLYGIYEEMGRYVVASPILDTVAIGADVIAAVGSEDQKRALLPAIAAGDEIISLALQEADGGFGPGSVALTATRSGDNYLLDGLKMLVGFVPSANHLLVAARTSGELDADGVSLFLVDAKAKGINATRHTNISGGALYAVEFDGVSTPASSLVGGEGAGWAPLLTSMTKAGVLQTCTIVGAARSVLEMTNQYGKDRHQFGVAIGSFQAVQYMITDVLLDLHKANLLAKQAAFRIHTGRSFTREAAIAIAFGKQAAAHLHRQAHEVFAGIAFMLEHDLTLFSRRSKYWEYNLGGADFWEDIVAEHLID
ncbi:MAG: acyl-CoA dehydrogenase family protein [Acidimicrobiia bacterium]